MDYADWKALCAAHWSRAFCAALPMTGSTVNAANQADESLKEFMKRYPKPEAR